LRTSNEHQQATRLIDRKAALIFNGYPYEVCVKVRKTTDFLYRGVCKILESISMDGGRDNGDQPKERLEEFQCYRSQKEPK
jgi:hypothetical protein